MVISIDALLPHLRAAIERDGEEICAAALRAGPAHLLYEAAELCGLATDHLDDAPGDERPVAPEMAARAALLALVVAEMVASR